MTRPNLRVVPDTPPLTVADQLRPTPEEQDGHRRIKVADVIAALETLGLSTRYVKAIGFEEDGLWVHSVIPGKSGGIPIAQREGHDTGSHVEYLPIDWDGHHETPEHLENPR